MSKSPPKRLDNQYNVRASIHRRGKAKRPKNPHQKSAQKTEAIKANTIMEQSNNSDVNGHGCNTSINHFAPLFESDDEEGTKHRTKFKTPIIVLSEYEEEYEDNEEDEDDQERKKTAKTYEPDIDNELNGDFRIAEFDNNSDNDE